MLQGNVSVTKWLMLLCSISLVHCRTITANSTDDYNPCDGVHELFPDPKNCSKFYHCDGLRPYHKDCPASLEWSVSENRCEWPWKAGCSGSPTSQPRSTPQPASSSSKPGPTPTQPEPGYNPCDGVHEFFPDPEDCSKFYQCNGLTPFHLDCPGDLQWSVDDNQCEWPSKAGCSGSPTSQPRPTPQPASSSSKPGPTPTQPEPGYNPCDGVHEFFPDPEDCSKFYQCNGLTPFHLDCPGDLQWSVDDNQCEWPSKAGCSGSPTSQPRPTPQPASSSSKPGPTPTQPEPGYNPCDGVHEFFPDPEDCSKFYQCNGLTPFHLDCPGDLQWSVADNQCEWRWKAGCSGSPTSQPRSTPQPASSSSKPGPTPTQPEPGYNPCDGVHEFFPDPEDCSKFYQCNGLTPFHLHCPGDLQWSVADNQCEWRWKAGCSGSPTSQPRSTPQPASSSKPGPGYNPCDGVHEFFPDPDNCRKFYQCSGLTPFHKDCPGGLEWSVIVNQCEWPWDAGCSGSPTRKPQPRPTTAKPGPGYNPCDGVHEFFPDPEDCGKFYQCSGLTPFHIDCPGDLQWSVSDNQCEWPWKAGCYGSPTSQPQSTPQPASSSPKPGPTPTQPEPGYNPCDGVHEFFPDPENCGKFYQCSGLTPFHKDCPSDLQWSVADNQCEWPLKAGCSGSLT